MPTLSNTTVKWGNGTPGHKPFAMDMAEWSNWCNITCTLSLHKWRSALVVTLFMEFNGSLAQFGTLAVSTHSCDSNHMGVFDHGLQSVLDSMFFLNAVHDDSQSTPVIPIAWRQTSCCRLWSLEVFDHFSFVSDVVNTPVESLLMRLQVAFCTDDCFGPM